jgi:glycosyltransferase involved in cell wall biosynthesis
LRDLSKLRVAIVHYWLLGHAGGERVVEALADIFPQADLYAAIADPARMPPGLRHRRIRTSFLQKIPFSKRFYRHLLLAHPLALEALDFSGYDLILSSESGPAKGILSPAETCHICYCHTPMRYLWDMYHGYRSSLPIGTRSIFSLGAHYMRLWDTASAARVDYFVANSHNVASRIRKIYRRDSTVIYPPAVVEDAELANSVEDYYLVVSRLTAYKRVDLAIEACKRLGRRLRIVGTGGEYKALRRMGGPGIEFLGHLSDREVHKNYASCRALLFPGEEDFGIVPVEAQSFGRPVIAFGRGGVLETVIGMSSSKGIPARQATGVFFFQQAVDAVVQAIMDFESAESQFDSKSIRDSVSQFSRSRFEREISFFVQRALLGHRVVLPERSEAMDEADLATYRKGG